MAKQKTKVKKTLFGRKKVCDPSKQTDSSFFLKLVLYFICGTLWVRLLHINIGPFEHLSLPLGLVIGVAFASHECFQMDKKVEFAVLLGATFISFYLPVGITI